MAKQCGTAFKKALAERVKTHHTRVIHALDIANTLPADASEGQRQQLVEQACHLATAIAPHVVAIKLNYPLVLATGLSIAHHIKTIVPEIPLIADFKVADIDNTNAWIARHTFSAGFDAIIVHGFIGNDAIQAVLNEARKQGDRGVILVVDMSHPGATQFIHPQTPQLSKLALDLKVTGVIAPGTRPLHVKEIRDFIGPNILILAPGVGAQGGKAGSAIAAGADYEIIGRSIYKAHNPTHAVQQFANLTYNATKSPIGDDPIRKPQRAHKLVHHVATLLDDVGAWKFGSFRLASGKTSPYYIDLRLMPSYPNAFGKLIDLLIEWLSLHPEVRFNRIAGVPTAGISFATLLCQRLNKPLLYVRSKTKIHGRQQRIEGELKKGDRVLIIDDLITDGGSKLEVVNTLRDSGAKVSDVLVVVDREQGGVAKLEKEKVNLWALTSVSDLVKALVAENRLSEKDAQKIFTYITQQ